MALTSIGDQLTPGRPIEVTFAADLGTPSDNQELMIVGRRASSGASGTVADYEVATMTNVAELSAASGEAITKFGDGELAAMIIAAVRAVQGLGTAPAIRAVPMPSANTDFGASDEALTAAKQVKQEFFVSPFDGQTDSANRAKSIEHAQTISGAQRVENNQFGTMAVHANQSVSDVSTLDKPDSQYFVGIFLRDSAPTLTYIGELAAAAAARMAANGVPFNPLDGQTVNGLPAPASDSDKITVGAGLESETVLTQGWTPMQVKPNGEVAFVRTVTGRRTVDADGVTDVTSYYDVQDFQVLYFWRKTLFTRFNQTDWKTRKAGAEDAREAKAELIRLARLFEDQNMFQAVAQLAKQFQVERSSSDRHRFDYKTPVNVIPGLHVLAGNVEASTQFDSLSI